MPSLQVMPIPNLIYKHFSKTCLAHKLGYEIIAESISLTGMKMRFALFWNTIKSNLEFLYSYS